MLLHFSKSVKCVCVFNHPHSVLSQRAAYTTVLQEWLRVSCHKAADTTVVKAYMNTFASVSPQLLEFVINMADGNGNTALHYTVSHSNFPVVKLLLDTGECQCVYMCVCMRKSEGRDKIT